MEAYKCRIGRVGQQVGDPGKLMVHFQSKGWQARDPVGPMFQSSPKTFSPRDFCLASGSWSLCSLQAFNSFDEAQPHY